jgi:Ca-activated chloride channel family protein
MNIAAPENYWYFVSIPALLILFFYAYWRRSKIKAKFASPKMMLKLSPPLSEARVVLKAGATILVLVFLVLALIRPQWGKKSGLS